MELENKNLSPITSPIPPSPQLGHPPPIPIHNRVNQNNQLNSQNIEVDNNINNNNNNNENHNYRDRSQSGSTNITDPSTVVEDDYINTPRTNQEVEFDNDVTADGKHEISRLIWFKHWWWHKGYSVLILTLYFCLNIGLAAITFHKSYILPQYKLLGLALCFSRSGAMIINLNSCLLLLPVIRNVVSWLRGTWISTYIPIDRNISFHKLCASGIVLGSFMHCISHYNNFYILLDTDKSVLDQYGIDISKYTDCYKLFYKSMPGITGHLMAFILVLIVTSSIERIRRPMFEIFYYTHHLFIFYYILLCIHGIEKLFGFKPNSYLWVSPPILFYLIERSYRLIKGNRPVMLHMAKQHPSKVLELRMKKENFKFKAGQYLYLQCPSISNKEWHPFTITSSPEDNYLGLHINIVGNWTGKLYNLLNPDEKLGIVQNEVLKGPNGKSILKIDGPFGASSEDVFKYRVAVLVGAGIGATPFASVLKHIKYQLMKSLEKQEGENQQLPFDKVYFFWISREKNSFQWFTFILQDIESKCQDLIEIHTYLTGSIEISDWNAIVSSMSTIDTEIHSDFITGLKSQTLFGRPNWDHIFIEIAKLHRNKGIGVFYCGPRALEKEIKKKCSKYNGIENCKFDFFKENF